MFVLVNITFKVTLNLMKLCVRSHDNGFYNTRIICELSIFMPRMFCFFSKDIKRPQKEHLVLCKQLSEIKCLTLRLELLILYGVIVIDCINILQRKYFLEVLT